MKATRAPKPPADHWEPATLEAAWAQWQRDHPVAARTPDTYDAFRAGYRRGISQGAVIAASIPAHTSYDPHD